MLEIKTISLFLVAALAESDGHYLPHLWPCEVDGVKPTVWDVVGS